MSEAPHRPGATPPRLEVAGATVRFGELVALDGAHLSVAPGEVHALLGQNGSGKSTLVKVLAGLVRPEPGGQVQVDGAPLHLPVRAEALRHHEVSFVHQDLGLVEGLSVRDNLRVGRFAHHRLTRAIRRGREAEASRTALAAVGCDVAPEAAVASLSVTDRARVAIARAIQERHPGVGLVVLDEATRALPPDASAIVHGLTRQIADSGGSVLLVTHRLDEVLLVADRVTVLRDGVVTTSGQPTAGLATADLSRLILGHDLDTSGLRPPAPPAATGGSGAPAPLARITGLAARGVDAFDLDIAPGEVVGVTGVSGAGFEELPYAVAGSGAATAGRLAVGGGQVDLARAGHAQVAALRVALVPEARARLGLALGRTIRENVTLPRVRARSRRLVLGRAWQQAEALEVIDRFAVAAQGPEQPVGELSGGNQQKVLLGKWLLEDPLLLVVHEPTQGVDVGARRELLTALADLARGGAAVLVATSEADDLAAVCDRVLVMEGGRVARTLHAPLLPTEIVHAVYGRERLAAPAPAAPADRHPEPIGAP